MRICGCQFIPKHAFIFVLEMQNLNISDSELLNCVIVSDRQLQMLLPLIKQLFHNLFLELFGFEFMLNKIAIIALLFLQKALKLSILFAFETLTMPSLIQQFYCALIYYLGKVTNSLQRIICFVNNVRRTQHLNQQQLLQFHFKYVRLQQFVLFYLCLFVCFTSCNLICQIQIHKVNKMISIFIQSILINRQSFLLKSKLSENYIKVIIMLQGALAAEWTVWLSYSHPINKEELYVRNLLKLVSLKSFQQFAYFWSNSPIAQPSNFFVDPITGKYLKYQIDGIEHKIESINFFKNQIQPTWQFGDNNKGGYFNFSISKESNEVSNTFKAMIFMAVGNALRLSDRINGIRLVDTAMKNQYRCRVQIWVDFRESEDNLDLIHDYGQQLQNYFSQSKINVKQVRFFNIDTDNKNKIISQAQFKSHKKAHSAEDLLKQD